ncbi:hypothetical protein [Bacillus sp. FSL K6-3431]|uniref:hypothetical protein n=1 Tax=Bacillus sp. FSL K6-3431 TaxID=2921500 RepID=UPI0030F6E630
MNLVAVIIGILILKEKFTVTVVKGYQAEGKPAQRLKARDVVEIPEGVKHWQGATNSWFVHLALIGDPTKPTYLNGTS